MRAQSPSPIPARTTAPAPAAQSTTAPPILPTVLTVADPLMREIDRNIADSAALASMGSREKYLRLRSDNRYLERILRDQDKRIEELQKRLALLKVQREKGRSEQAAPLRNQNEHEEMEKQIERLDRLTATPAGEPAAPPPRF